MPIYQEFFTQLSRLSAEELNAIGWCLFKDDATKLPTNIQKQLSFEKYSIVCISFVNSKIYKVTKQGESEAFILKLEPLSRREEIQDQLIKRQEIQDKFKKNPVLKNALADVYFNESCTIEYTIKDKTYRDTMTIQLQPFCKGGTLESAARKKMTDEERIDSALKLYTQVAKFYIALQEENILFPDGKPRNFTLDENGELQLTDMKTYVKSSTYVLESCPAINDRSYPLYIPIAAPLTCNEVHARHFGMNLYAYLTGREWKDFYVPDSKNKRPLPTDKYTYDNQIFQSFEGGILASLIQNMIADDRLKRPSVEDAQKILSLVGQIRGFRLSSEENIDATIIATYHDFFVKQNPTLLRLANAAIVKDWVTNAVVNPDDAVKAFPHNAEIIKAAFDIKPTSLQFANAAIVQDLLAATKITPDVAVQAFPNNEDIVYAAYTQDSNSWKHASTAIVCALIQSKLVNLEDAMLAFPDDYFIARIACWRLQFQGIKSSVIQELITDEQIDPEHAVTAFPNDPEILKAALKIQSTSWKFANAALVKYLVTAGTVDANDAVQTFPNSQEILKAACDKHRLILKDIIRLYPSDQELNNYETTIRETSHDFQQLSNIINILRSPAYMAIMAEIQHLRQQSTVVTTNSPHVCQVEDERLARANKLEQALYTLPLEKRKNMSIDKLLSISAESDSTLQQKTAQYKASICDSKAQGQQVLDTDSTPPGRNHML